MVSLDFNQLATLMIVLAIAATASGFIAGLLGVGGGILMVPALYYAFSILEFDPNIIMHLSLGTSLAIIIPTSIMSAKTHYKFNHFPPPNQIAPVDYFRKHKNFIFPSNFKFQSKYVIC